MKKQSIITLLAGACIINTGSVVRAENETATTPSAVVAHALASQPERPVKPNVRIDRSGDLSYVVGSVLINAPRETVWNKLSDYDKAPEIFDNLSVCKVVGIEGETKLLRQMVRPGGLLKFDYIVNLTEQKPALISWYRRSGSFKEVRGSWTLDEVDGATVVTYRIHLDGGILLPPWLLNSQVKEYLPNVLMALKSSVEKTP